MSNSEGRKITHFFQIHSVYNWVTDKVLKLVMVTIFWPILTSVGHYSCIIFLENKTILVTELSPKQNIMIKLGLWRGVFKIISTILQQNWDFYESLIEFYGKFKV